MAPPKPPIVKLPPKSLFPSSNSMIYSLLLATLGASIPVNFNDDSLSFSQYEDSFLPAMFTPATPFLEEEAFDNDNDQELYIQDQDQEEEYQDSDDFDNDEEYYDLQDFEYQEDFDRYNSFQAANALESSVRSRSGSSASTGGPDVYVPMPVPKPYVPKNKFKAPNLGALEPAQAGKLVSAAKQAYSSAPRQNSFMNRNLDAYKQGFSHQDASLDPSKKNHRKAFKNAVEESAKIGQVRDSQGRTLGYDTAQEARKQWVDHTASIMAKGGRNLKAKLSAAAAKQIAYSAGMQTRGELEGGGFSSVPRSAFAAAPAAAAADTQNSVG